MKLSIIIPTYNEQRTIKELVRAVQRVQYPVEHEIIIVDDASVDRTYEKSAMLKNYTELENIRLFKNDVNKGKGYSIRIGIKRAKGDFVVIQDADNEYSPEDIPKLLQPLIDGKAEVVYGSRFLGKKYPDGMAFPNWIANKVLTAITNILFGTRLTDMETCYKVMRTDFVRQLPLKANRFAFEPEITALIARRKVKISELPIQYSGRTAKKGKKIKAKDFFFALGTLVKYFFFK